MRVSNLILVAVLALAGMAGFLESKLQAQPLTAPVNITPDCLIFYDFSANASSANFDNRFLGCKTWYVAYTSTGFPALTLTFESDTDTTGAPTPGGWVAFAGAIVEGVNPNVALTQGSTIMYGYYPWVRLTLTNAVAGAGRRLRGTFYGYRQTPVATLIVGPAAVVTADQGAPNTDANRWPFYLSDGANPQGTQANPLYTQVPGLCTLSAPIELAPAAIGVQEIVALTVLQAIRVCSISLSNSGAADLRLVQGTGANCVVGPANVTGTFRNVLSWVDAWQSNPLTLNAGQALCLSSSAAVNIGGVILYAKQ